MLAEAESWEMVFKIAYKSKDGFQNFLGDRAVAYGLSISTSLRLYLIDANNTLYSPVLSWTENEIYYIKFVLSNQEQQYILDIYRGSNGVDYEHISTLNLAAKPFAQKHSFGLGSTIASNDAFAGSFDLSGCYIKFNGEHYWKGAELWK